MNNTAVEEVFRIAKQSEHKLLAGDLRDIAARLERAARKLQDLYGQHNANTQEAIGAATIARQWASHVEADGRRV